MPITVPACVNWASGSAPRQAEIDDPDPAPPLLQPNVRRLDVTVDQTARVSRTQTFGDLPTDAQHFGQWQPPAGPVQPVSKRLTAEHLHGQERDAAVLPHLIDGDDVLMVDCRGQPGFAQESPVKLSAGRQARVHDLEGHQASEMGILGLEDDAHGASAQNLQDAVDAQATQLVRFLRRRQKGIVRGRGQLKGVGKGGRRIFRGGGRVKGRLPGGRRGAGRAAEEESDGAEPPAAGARTT